VFTINSVEPSSWVYAVLVADTWYAAEARTRLIYSTTQRNTAKLKLHSLHHVSVDHKNTTESFTADIITGTRPLTV